MNDKADKLDCLKPEHGKPLKVMRNDKNRDLFEQLANHYNQLTIDIMLVYNLVHVSSGEFIDFHCKQCIKNIATNAKDLASLLQELSEK